MLSWNLLIVFLISCISSSIAAMSVMNPLDLLSDPDAEDVKFFSLPGGYMNRKAGWQSGQLVTFKFQIEHARHAKWFLGTQGHIKPDVWLVKSCHVPLVPSEYLKLEQPVVEQDPKDLTMFTVRGVVPKIKKAGFYQVKIMVPRSRFFDKTIAESDNAGNLLSFSRNTGVWIRP